MEAPIKFIEGKRIYLRPIEEKDIPMLYASLWDREARRLTGTQTIFSLKGVEQFIISAATDQSRMDLLICLQENDLCIGDIAMTDINYQNRNASVRIALFNKAYWGNGYGTEAMEQLITHGFEQLNLHRIELEVFDFNTRAKKSYEKLGFKQEGIRREVLFYDGEYHNAIIMSVLKDEFLKND
ncbi:GNAT family N-acetyltransferase [Virgibacillus pantothenticus]|uniref:GNAT family N-acetyltransferase n=1 Tax=Virgibacillus pantothenticus TaxID=1473 RepID=UPI0009841DCF|nr:GNAT family protein [Virgibacillus pantothenticus]